MASVKHRIDMWRYEDELKRIKAKKAPGNCMLFYGSSTFAHWVEIEEDFKKYQAINAGFGGSTSDEANYHYDDIVKKFNPKILVWYYGDNEPVCSYSLKETKICFKEFFTRFHKDYPDSLIIVLATKSSYARKEYFKYVIELDSWLKKYCQDKYYMEYIESKDIWFKDDDYNYENFEDDKLHYNRKGNLLIKERIISAISKKRTLDIKDSPFWENNLRRLQVKRKEALCVSIITAALLILSLLISPKIYWPFFLFNCLLSIAFVIYIVYTLRNVLYELKKKARVYHSMRNSLLNSEYLIYQGMTTEYEYEGFQVLALHFKNSNEEERTIHLMEEYPLYLEKNKRYEIESLANFIVGVKKINEK